MARRLMSARLQGTAGEAGRLLDESLHRAPRDPRLLIESGRFHLQGGRHREAARRLLMAIEAAPIADEPHRLLADSLEALGESAEALRHRGLYYSLRDRPSRALIQFERFRDARPDSLDAPLLISQSLVQMQQNERAIAILERYPHEAALRENLATLYLMTLSRREAAATCDEWLRAEPNAARPHWILGRAAQSNQRLDAAIIHYETAVTREPKNAEYLASLGGALVRRASPQDLARARELFERSVLLAPDAPDLRVQLGASRLRSGDAAAAIAEYYRALDLDPASSTAYNGLVQAAQRLGKPHQVALWARAMREVQDRGREETRLRREAGAQPRDPARFIALATALIRSGSLARAEGNLEEAVELRPSATEARNLLARVRAARSAR
jgi:cytochrome c-type biogenesis protein CcmH/NrfG